MYGTKLKNYIKEDANSNRINYYVRTRRAQEGRKETRSIFGVRNLRLAKISSPEAKVGLLMQRSKIKEKMALHFQINKDLYVHCDAKRMETQKKASLSGSSLRFWTG